MACFRKGRRGHAWHETSRGMHRSWWNSANAICAHVLLSYKDFYNSTRTHWSLNKDAGPSRRRAGPECIAADPRRSPCPSMCPGLICDKDNRLLTMNTSLSGSRTRRKFTPSRGRRRRRACPARLRARF